jgi:hypothetical protein
LRKLAAALVILGYVIGFVVLFNGIDVLRLRWQVIAEGRVRRVVSRRDDYLAVGVILVPALIISLAGYWIFGVFAAVHDLLFALILWCVAVGWPGFFIIHRVVAALREYRKAKARSGPH